ncbi:MAG: 50S ribosomal protein L22 [Bacteroides sp.]|jgi:ribosomal protein L22
MGNRKALSAQRRAEANKERCFAILRNCPLSPRKVRLVADMIRGVEVNRALGLLRYSTMGSAPRVEKLLVSALANWGVKNPGRDVDSEELVVRTIMVDEGRTLKRIRPRAQGRANRILKRSCHVTLEVGAPLNDLKSAQVSVEANVETGK